jgi:hypothetical protein
MCMGVNFYKFGTFQLRKPEDEKTIAYAKKQIMRAEQLMNQFR